MPAKENEVKPVKKARAPKDPAASMVYFSITAKEAKKVEEILHFLELENATHVKQLKDILNLE